MARTIKDLTLLNQLSIEELEAYKHALRSRMPGLATDQKFAILSTISDLELRTRTLEFTQVHLEVAKVVVQFNPEDEEKLRVLSDQLDHKISADAQLGAVLDSLPAVMSAAARIDGLINSHIASA